MQIDRLGVSEMLLSLLLSLGVVPNASRGIMSHGSPVSAEIGDRKLVGSSEYVIPIAGVPRHFNEALFSTGRRQQILKAG